MPREINSSCQCTNIIRMAMKTKIYVHINIIIIRAGYLMAQ